MMTQQAYSRMIYFWQDAWGKPMKRYEGDLIKDTKDYRLWLKQNEQKHKDYADLSKGVVYKGSMF